MKKRYLPFLILSLLLPVTTNGQSDLFEIRMPNVMIIFDTSSSMNMDVNGNPVPSGISKGVDGKDYDFEGGGNHPKSKLYIAKQALGDVLKGIENINMGLATYGQRKQEKYRGNYKKLVITQAYQPPRNWCDKRYYRWTTTNDTSPRYANSFSADSFTDYWGEKHTGVIKDVYTFKRKVWIHDRVTYLHPPRVGGSFQTTKEYWIEYKVTDISYNAEYNWYVFKYEVTSPAYDLYQETTRRIEPCGACGPDAEDNPFSRNWGTYKTYFSGEDEYENPSIGRSSKWWSCTPGSSPEVKEKWDWVTQWRTYSGPITNCNKTQTDGWEYVEKCHDVSEYYYPIGPSPALPFDSVNRPHTWSYFKITSGSSDTWKESDQPSPFYPASAGGPGVNPNNFLFINFPEVDDASNDYKVKKEILKWLDLTPVQNPETNRYHTKLPLKADSLTSNTIESLFTPLADSLLQAKKYFEDYIFKHNGGDAASKSNCRGNYIILMTDGLESARFKGPNDPDYDKAAHAAKELLDLVKDKNGNSCGVKTYVIGFGEGLGDKPWVLGNIADKGDTGNAYFAKDLSQLREAFKKIFQQIGPGYSRSNPVVTSARDRIYRGYFNLPGWEGHLIAFALGTDGNIIDQNNDKKIDEQDTLWDAGRPKEIGQSARATVYTWDKDKNPNLFEFNESSAGKLKDLINLPEEDMNEDGKKDIEDVQAIIRFILNPGSDGGKYKGSRSTTWSLGDIYHSTPLVVGKPPFNISDDLFPKKYSQFKENQKNRPTTIYVGANDGFLHAFDAKDGKEKFSVIPKNLLGKLKEIRNAHRFYVDSSPRAYDVYFSKGKDEWATVLISGLRGGGNYYFALDVTDPAKPEVLWEMTDPALGFTWSRPEIGWVKIGGKEKFVAFVGGGYSDPNDPKNDNIGNSFYVIDIEDEGKILRKFDVGNKSNRVPAGATAFDKDGDGRIDGVYFGDIQGTLWKIKIDGEENIDKWALVKLFEPGVKNAIFYPPAVTKNNQGKVLVYFGQGDELDLFEKERTYSFYEIWDKGDSGEKIWEKQFTNKGEKVLASPSVGNNIVYFTTWQYTGIEADCGAGTGRLYGLTTTKQGVEGGVAGLFFDISGVKLDKPVASIDLGKGIPSAPVVIPGRIYISTSLNANHIISIPIPHWGRGKLKSWREVF